MLLLNTLFLPSDGQTSIKSSFQLSDHETTDLQVPVTALCIIYVTLSSLANSNCSLGKYHWCSTPHTTRITRHASSHDTHNASLGAFEFAALWRLMYLHAWSLIIPQINTQVHCIHSIWFWCNPNLICFDMFAFGIDNGVFIYWFTLFLHVH